MKSFRNSLSSDSWEFSWNSSHRRRRPFIVPQSQSGRNVTLTSFLLCFISVYLLSCGLILAVLSTWSLIRKIPYNYLAEVQVDIPYFALPAAALCFPCSWIAMSIHNNKKKYQFLHLYDTNAKYYYAWNKMQRQLSCCGVMGYQDWLNINHTTPNSCCKNDYCNATYIYQRGCLESLMRDLTWLKNILSSQCYITALLQVVTVILAAAVYFLEKHSN